MPHQIAYFACGVHIKARCGCHPGKVKSILSITITDIRCPGLYCEDPDGAMRKEREAIVKRKEGK